MLRGCCMIPVGKISSLTQVSARADLAAGTRRHSQKGGNLWHLRLIQTPSAPEPHIKSRAEVLPFPLSDSNQLLRQPRCVALWSSAWISAWVRYISAAFAAARGIWRSCATEAGPIALAGVLPRATKLPIQRFATS